MCVWNDMTVIDNRIGVFISLTAETEVSELKNRFCELHRQIYWKDPEQFIPESNIVD